MASQPLDEKQIDALIRQGYPVFGPEWIARVKAEMNAIDPLVPTSKSPISGDQKYSALVRCIKYRSRIVRAPKTAMEPFVMPENSSKKMTAEMLAELQKQLVKEKLLRPVPATRSGAARFELTEQGRRFVADYEREHKPKK